MGSCTGKIISKTRINMKVKIYSKDNCQFCDMAIKECELKEIDHEVLKLDVDFNREQLFETFPGARTFPQILIDDAVVGGYKEFKEFLANN